MTPTSDSKERFSNRVADYIRYRPGYPPGVLELLRDECGLTQESAIADVGSGTGILTRLFLENGNSVYAVEPNAAMREAGEELLAAYPKFASVAAAAEATGLPDATVDFVMAAQAVSLVQSPGGARGVCAHPATGRLGRRDLERAQEGLGTVCRSVRTDAARIRNGLPYGVEDVSRIAAHVAAFRRGFSASDFRQ